MSPSARWTRNRKKTVVTRASPRSRRARANRDGTGRGKRRAAAQRRVGEMRGGRGRHAAQQSRHRRRRRPAVRAVAVIGHEPGRLREIAQVARPRLAGLHRPHHAREVAAALHARRTLAARLPLEERGQRCARRKSGRPKRRSREWRRCPARNRRHADRPGGAARRADPARSGAADGPAGKTRPIVLEGAAAVALDDCAERRPQRHLVDARPPDVAPERDESRLVRP